MDLPLRFLLLLLLFMILKGGILISRALPPSHAPRLPPPSPPPSPPDRAYATGGCPRSCRSDAAEVVQK